MDNNDVEKIIKRSLPGHSRKEERIKYDPNLRKPMVSITRKKKKIFEFGNKGFHLLDISKNGACILTESSKKTPYAVNEDVFIAFSNGVESLATVRWFIKEMDVDGYSEPQLAIGLQLKKTLTTSEIRSI